MPGLPGSLNREQCAGRVPYDETGVANRKGVFADEQEKDSAFWLGKLYWVFLKLYDSSKAEIIALSDSNREVLKKQTEFTQAIIEPEKICGQLKGYGIAKDSLLNFGELYQKLIVQGEYELMGSFNGCSIMLQLRTGHLSNLVWKIIQRSIKVSSYEK